MVEWSGDDGNIFLYTPSMGAINKPHHECCLEWGVNHLESAECRSKEQAKKMATTTAQPHH